MCLQPRLHTGHAGGAYSAPQTSQLDLGEGNKECKGLGRDRERKEKERKGMEREKGRRKWGMEIRGQGYVIGFRGDRHLCVVDIGHTAIMNAADAKSK